MINPTKPDVECDKCWDEEGSYSCIRMSHQNNLAKDLKSLGNNKTTYKSTYDPKVLETFPNPQQHTAYTIHITAPEFSNLCPKTGQPDFATIHVTYSPRKKCVESKSFKLYIFSFRQSGAFHEDVTNKIAQDLFDLLDPHWITVMGEFKPRGGISFHPTVTLKRKR